MFYKQVLGLVLMTSGLCSVAALSLPTEGSGQRYYVCYKDVWAPPDKQHAIQHYRQCTNYGGFTDASNHPRDICPKYNAYRYRVFDTLKDRDDWRNKSCNRWHYQ
jgi:hypothetical protein